MRSLLNITFTSMASRFTRQEDRKDLWRRHTSLSCFASGCQELTRLY